MTSFFLCSIVLPPVGHSSKQEYHFLNLQDNRAVFQIFIALLKFFILLSLVLAKRS